MDIRAILAPALEFVVVVHLVVIMIPALGHSTDHLIAGGVQADPVSGLDDCVENAGRFTFCLGTLISFIIYLILLSVGTQNYTELTGF